MFYSTLIMREKFNLKTESKINLLVTFKQQFVTQSKLFLFPHKTDYFSNNSHGAYKNLDDNSKFHITKLNTLKLTF